MSDNSTNGIMYFPTNTQIGNANTPTLTISGTSLQAFYFAEGDFTVSPNCKLIMQQGNGGSTGAAMNCWTGSGTFTLGAGATLEVQDRQSDDGSGTGTWGGVSGSNFPGNN